MIDLTHLSVKELVKISHELNQQVVPEDALVRKYVPADSNFQLNIIALNVSVRLAMTKILEKTFNL